MKGTIIILSLLLVLSSLGQAGSNEYTILLQETLMKKNDFKLLYNNSDSSGRDSIIIYARNYLLERITNDIFPCWYGTNWDFNGTTRIPKQGNIACGYFVTNILTDIGFNIPRIKWAQSASEVFIKKLAPDNIMRFSNSSISKVEQYLLNNGDGLYLVGLDSHVGFIAVKDKTIKFVHSNYYQPEIGVISEDIDSINPLNDSSYRIIGKLLSNKMMINWINDEAYN